MSVNPEAVGDPPEQADDYLKEANAEDPRDDQQAPAHEPAKAENPDEGPLPPGAPV
jgi:hypothetical protein